MGIALLTEHVALADAVAAVSAKYASIESTRDDFEGLAAGKLPAVWPRLLDQGLLVLHLPESVGGDEAGLLELAVILEQAGRALLPGPLLPTLAAGTLVARHARAGETRDGLLVQIAGGAPGAVVGDPTGVSVHPHAEGWALSGTSVQVSGALGAELVVLGAEADDRIVWFVLGPDQLGKVSRRRAEGVDLTRDIGSLDFTGLVVPADLELAAESSAVSSVMAVLSAAEAVGLARWCQETGLKYVKIREQFGRPVGSFQAVKHKCARLFSQVEAMTAAAWDAALAGEEDDPDQFALAAAGAAETCVQGAVDVALETITVLGGIGYTWEHDTHLFWRRAISLAAQLGPRNELRTRIGRLAVSITRASALTLDDEPANLRAEVAETLARAKAEPEPIRRALLADERLVAPHYPEPYGRGVDPVGQVVIAQEFERAGLERPTTMIGEWVLPTLIAHGSDRQREEFVDPTLRGEIVWCQLFSEPGAGSDLVSLTTRAVKVNGGWRLNGQKVWTSRAHEAHFGICLARTDPDVPKHKGIGYFVIDMRAPGVTVRPLREANGGYLFNEVIMEDVVVPDSRLVGAPTDGWRLARTTLGNERVSIATGVGHELDLVALAAAAQDRSEAALAEVGVLAAEAVAVQALGRRELLQRLAGHQPGARSSIQKLLKAWHESHVRRAAAGWHGAGAAVTDGVGGVANAAYLGLPPLLIGGGTVEIQLNVIAEAVLGLPRG